MFMHLNWLPIGSSLQIRKKKVYLYYLPCLLHLLGKYFQHVVAPSTVFVPCHSSHVPLHAKTLDIYVATLYFLFQGRQESPNYVTQKISWYTSSHRIFIYPASLYWEHTYYNLFSLFFHHICQFMHFKKIYPWIFNIISFVVKVFITLFCSIPYISFCLLFLFWFI